MLDNKQEVTEVNGRNGRVKKARLPEVMAMPANIVKRDGQGGQVIGLSDLTVGENVLVIGVRSSDGTSMEAKTIIAGKQGGPQDGAQPKAGAAAPRA